MGDKIQEEEEEKDNENNNGERNGADVDWLAGQQGFGFINNKKIHTNDNRANTLVTNPPQDILYRTRCNMLRLFVEGRDEFVEFVGL